MNDKELREKLIKTQKQIDVASEIYTYAFVEAIKIVDEHLPFKREADKAKLYSERHDANLARSEAISVFTACLLSLSEGVRL